MSQVTKLPKELTPAQEEQISQAFSSHEMQLAGYKNSFNHIINQELTPELAKQARAMRLEIAKVRQASNKTHKVQKAFALAYGRFVDSKKNVIEDLAKSFEVPLKKIEYYEKIALEKKQAELQKSRALLLSKYTQNIPSDLGTHTEDMFDAILNGFKLKFENDEKQRKIQAEQDRLQSILNKRKMQVQKYSLFADVQNLPLTLETTEAEFKVIIEQLEVEFENYKASQPKPEPIIHKPIPNKNLTPQQELEAWVNGFSITYAPVNNEVSQEIIKKFNAFKKWALTQIK